tara:strand:- start:328 stop:603 length:276 start_codon:yes stop_codon:yes gene_type:complete
MKILIWVHKNEAISGEISNYFFHCPQQTNWPEYVQIEITQDEFAKLEDRDIEDDIDREADWLINQYNRNRPNKEHINSIDELDQNNQAFGD